MADEIQPDITTLTVQLLSAFVSNNNLAAEGLPDLIRSTRAALTTAPDAAKEGPETEMHKPAVSVRKSLSSPDHIVSLIDGKPYKTLKRHLAAHGLTPDQYRERYSLPKSYPLVASSYSEARRAVAAKLGLGKRPAVAREPEAGAIVTSQPAAPVPAPKVSKAAPKKGTMLPAKKQPPKVKTTRVATHPAPLSDTPAAASAKVSPNKKAPRKRLSLALPQAANAKTEPAAAANTKAPSTVEPKARAKLKTTSKRKSAKAETKTAAVEPSADAQANDLPKAE